MSSSWGFRFSLSASCYSLQAPAKALTQTLNDGAVALLNDPIALRIVGIIAIIGGITIALQNWSTPLRWWQLPLIVFAFGIASFIRSFLIEQGYVNKP